MWGTTCSTGLVWAVVRTSTIRMQFQVVARGVPSLAPTAPTTPSAAVVWVPTTCSQIDVFHSVPSTTTPTTVLSARLATLTARPATPLPASSATPPITC